MNVVFNNKFGAPYNYDYPKFTAIQEEELIAGLFEELLIFDQIVINTNRLNYALLLLVHKLGLNTVEELFGRGYIKIMIWSPALVAATGHARKDGTIDESVIYGKPPIVGGALTEKDLDPVKNIHSALDRFQIQRDRKRIFTRIARDHYVVPNGMEFSTESAKFVIDAYNHDNLKHLGLPYGKEPNQLDLEERKLLLNLSHNVLETAVLAKYNYKSYEVFEHLEICKQSIENIGNALSVSQNSSTLFDLEGLPNLKELYLSEKIDFNRIFTIRNLPTAKYFRKWINEISQNADSTELTKEYLNEIKGNSKFFNSTGGRFLKYMASLGLTSAIGSAVGGPIGSFIGGTLGLLDALWFDNILIGRNPSMFIDRIKKEVDEK
jgi:hypothetical protein